MYLTHLLFYLQDTISGNVILRNAGCASTDKPLLGSVTLRVVVTLDSQLLIIVFLTSSTGLFSRKRVTLCEEKVDMAFYPNVCSVFSFNRVDIGRRLAVYTMNGDIKCRSRCQIATLDMGFELYILLLQNAYRSSPQQRRS